MSGLSVLDLFSAAAGGWSLGMHRAGFKTVAACEFEEWRRILYSENNPGVRLYDDVRTLTGERLLRDLGALPDIIVGSPPCQDISSANTKGKGVDGERSRLFFEAVRIAGECRSLDPRSARWVALENSANLRTKGADRVIAALAAHDYTVEPFVVGAGDGKRCAGVGANHERARAWVLGFNAEQLTDPDGYGRDARWSRGRGGLDLPVSDDPEHSAEDGHEGGRARGRGSDGLGSSPAPRSVSGVARNADQQGLAVRESERGDHESEQPAAERANRSSQVDVGYTSEDGRGSGRTGRRALPTPGLPVEARRDDDTPGSQVGWSEGLGPDASGPWSEWNGGLAGHLRVDDGLSAWVASTRVAVGGPRGTVGSALIVEAFGDAVLPQIPEAIGRAILRTEAALAAIYAQAAA